MLIQELLDLTLRVMGQSAVASLGERRSCYLTRGGGRFGAEDHCVVANARVKYSHLVILVCYLSAKPLVHRLTVAEVARLEIKQ